MWGEEIPLIGTLLHGNINAFDGLFFFFLLNCLGKEPQTPMI